MISFGECSLAAQICLLKLSIDVDLAENAGEIENLYFVDFSGKLIDNVRYIQKGDKAAVDANHLQSGIYIMDVTTKLGHSRVKVVIQK